MKYIIIGLGNFGASLAEKLTAMGNEVIGIDRRMEKVDFLKERISHTICMDATDEFTVSGLPLKDTDVVIVAIGEDQGANVMATALMKNLQVKRLIGRALNPLHQRVLKALGVDEIIHPEEETAERWANKLCLSGVVDSFDLNNDYSIIEVKLPPAYIGKKNVGTGFYPQVQHPHTHDHQTNGYGKKPERVYHGEPGQIGPPARSRRPPDPLRYQQGPAVFFEAKGTVI